jgi:hypothetical protein
MKEARAGYSFFSVTAPGVFIEYELPATLGIVEAMNDEEAAHWEELVAAAKRHGACIVSSARARGAAN